MRSESARPPRLLDSLPVRVPVPVPVRVPVQVPVRPVLASGFHLQWPVWCWPCCWRLQHSCGDTSKVAARKDPGDLALPRIGAHTLTLYSTLHPCPKAWACKGPLTPMSPLWAGMALSPHTFLPQPPCSPFRKNASSPLLQPTGCLSSGNTCIGVWCMQTSTVLNLHAPPSTHAKRLCVLLGGSVCVLFGAGFVYRDPGTWAKPRPSA